jgi:nucleoside diphosphate kinase
MEQTFIMIKPDGVQRGLVIRPVLVSPFPEKIFLFLRI